MNGDFKPDERVLEVIDHLTAEPFNGVIFRHMFANIAPSRENTLGARWNPPRIPAIYGCLQRETAIAESDFQMSTQEVRITSKRTIYRLRVSLHSVITIPDINILDQMGIKESELKETRHEACQRVGGTISWIGNDGLIVPSARHSGMNIVIFPNNQKSSYEFEILDSDMIFSGS